MSDSGEMRLELLLFSVHGVHFGVDTVQVAGVADYDGESAEDLFWFHEELAYGGSGTVYSSPKVLTIRSKNAQSYRVVIDDMEDIAEFSQNDICLLPGHVEPFAVKKGVWGVLPKNGLMVLLVDFQLLLKQKQQPII